MLTTRNSYDEGCLKPLIRGRHISTTIFDDLYGPSAYTDYDMVRLGTKHYGFCAKSGYPRAMTMFYRCSHVNAQRRFKAYLIAQQMKR